MKIPDSLPHGAIDFLAAEIARLQARIAELEAEREARNQADLIPLHAGRPGITAEAAEAVRAFT